MASSIISTISVAKQPVPSSKKKPLKKDLEVVLMPVLVKFAKILNYRCTKPISKGYFKIL